MLDPCLLCGPTGHGPLADAVPAYPMQQLLFLVLGVLAPAGAAPPYSFPLTSMALVQDLAQCVLMVMEK